MIGATVDLMVERGMQNVSVDAIAERSGVAKTTVYRHWPSRAALFLAALNTLVPEEEEEVTAELDIETAVRNVAMAFAYPLGTPPMSTLLPELLAAAARDDDMRAVYDEILRAHGKPLTRVIEAAVADGSLPDTTDVYMVVSLVMGPIALRQIIGREPIDTSFVERTVAVVLEAARQGIVK